jgi:hypothetical protein
MASFREDPQAALMGLASAATDGQVVIARESRSNKRSGKTAGRPWALQCKTNSLRTEADQSGALVSRELESRV